MRQQLLNNQVNKRKKDEKCNNKKKNTVRGGGRSWRGGRSWTGSWTGRRRTGTNIGDGQEGAATSTQQLI